MIEPTLLQPDPNSLVVTYHPHRELGDCVGMQFDDPKHGRFVVAFDPDVVEYLSKLFATAVESPRIRALADQMKAAQREA